jgi:hypothetical protein
MIKKIFGPRRDDVIRKFRALPNDKLHKLYRSPNIFRIVKSIRIRWIWNIRHMEKVKCAYRILLGKLLGNWSLESTKRRGPNIKVDLTGIHCENGRQNWLRIVYSSGLWY